MPWKSALDDHPEFVKAIGMISIENANLELALADLLAAVLIMPKRVAHAIYFTPRASALRVEILAEAAKARLVRRLKAPPDHPLEVQKREAQQKVERITKRTYAVIQRRHDVMHDAWGVDHEMDDKPVMRQKIGRAIFIDAIPVPLQTLLDLIRDFRALIEEVMSVTGELRREPATMIDLTKPSTKSGDSARTVKAVKPASRK